MWLLIYVVYCGEVGESILHALFVCLTAQLAMDVWECTSFAILGLNGQFAYL